MQAFLKSAPCLLAAATSLVIAGGPARLDAVPAEREVLVAARRLGKGAAAACDDFRLERWAARRVPAQALAPPCDVLPGSVALREIAERDVIRSQDVGMAPAVMAGSVVRVAVVSGAIRVTALAQALADANVGDAVAVRLGNPRRTVLARVIGLGAVELEAVQP